MRERRWIVLTGDGRHVTMGRHTDPTEEPLNLAADELRANGLGGWLAVTEGQYYSRGKLSVMMVRELAPASTTWEAAVAAFHTLRKRSLRRRPK
jgi:hypothetical protein